MAKSYGTKKEMEKEGGSFKALAKGNYIAKIIKNAVEEKKDFNGNLVPTLCLQFSPYEMDARNATMKDVDGATVKPLTRKLFQDINKVTMGFRDNFTLPSKYRALVAALQDVDPNADVMGPDELTAEAAQEQIEEFFGGYITVSVAVVEKNGVQRNKITDFQPVPEDFEADPVIEAQQEEAEKKRAIEKKNKSADDDAEEEALEEDDAEEAAPKKKKNTKKAMF